MQVLRWTHRSEALAPAGMVTAGQATRRLLARLSTLVRDGTLHLLRDGAPLAQDSPDAAAMLRQQLQDALRDLQRKGLLIA